MKRYWEIDSARGIAIILMIFYHIIYNLILLKFINLDIYNGVWWIFPRSIAAIFLLIVGISLTLSYWRVQNKYTKSILIRKYFFRGLKIFCLGIIISIISFIILKERSVYFGILHLIGLSIILAYPFVPFKLINLILGLVILTAGIILGFYRFNSYWLLWLGFRPQNYYPVDYLPLFPWFCFIPFGILAGNILFIQGKRRFSIPSLGKNPIVRVFSFLGRHSLVIYLFHLPVIYGMLLFIKIFV